MESKRKVKETQRDASGSPSFNPSAAAFGRVRLGHYDRTLLRRPVASEEGTLLG
jgi:hypothetical protein